MEYYNEYMFLHGRPYYRITETDDTYYLWELDRNDPDSLKYNILKTDTEFENLYKEGMELQDALCEELFPDEMVLPEEWKKDHKSER